MSRIVVAVDGPAGSGKSSVSKAVARKLGYAYLDTGAAYRAFAWHAQNAGVELEDAASVASALPSFEFSEATDPDHFSVRVGEKDVTDAIRKPAVTGIVSLVARVPEVRAALTEVFRSIAAATERDGIVIEGRDITTAVAPDAQVRVLLTASEEARMGRRSAELTGYSAQVVGEQLKARDRADSRVVDFMTAADGVTTVDSTELDFDETVDAVIAVIRTNL
ncbi:(d)CMP kinase [Gryllotalpicola protaetiae]|uniref:Cytidylate kinase n=1 Tax=Gryllotalpicola protaetiae TaxID=2419771 RepID=A0A387BL32_9MICO|nr:(d)CMP kinase [Gryllotalpicola protaetiae]AYG04583.1 (d)CMP kinase [Gryllotalpicola protaetiae]